MSSPLVTVTPPLVSTPLVKTKEPLASKAVPAMAPPKTGLMPARVKRLVFRSVKLMVPV